MMCASVADTLSAMTAEIRQGKKEEEDRRNHRATI